MLELTQAFRVVAEHYRCDRAERKLMWQLVKADAQTAAQSYLAMEREILGPAQGINERIRAELAETQKAKHLT